MKELTIYEFQLKTIVEALRLTYNQLDFATETCYDRQVRQAYEFAKNALENKKEIEVKY